MGAPQVIKKEGWIEMTVQLVLAADNNYMNQLFVALQSAMRSAGRDTKYEFHLLLSEDISRSNLDKLECLRALDKRHDFVIHHLKDIYRGSIMRIGHVSSVTYFRLQIPSLLAHAKKCIYLDCDVLVCQDLADLFCLDMREKYIAGVRAPRHYRTEKVIQETLSRLGIPSIDQYINAGVMLMNLERMREDGIEDRFRDLIKNNYPSQDEDIINKACFGMIEILPPRYNVMPYGLLSEPADEVYQNDPGLQRAYSFEEWNASRLKPVIIHYATRHKPWKDLSVNYAKRWWETAKELPFYEEILAQSSISLK